MKLRESILIVLGRVFVALLLLSSFSSLPAEDAEKDLCFPVGEKITYKLYWGVIPVGEAVFKTYWDVYEEKPVIVIRVTAKTTSVVKKIYPVNDMIESTVDPQTLLPLKYTQRLREGRHKRDDEVVFNHAKGEAVWKRTGRDETKIIEIDKDARDVVSLTYRMRGSDFDVCEKEKFKDEVDDKLYDLTVEGVKKEKRDVKTQGKIDCLLVEPKAKFGEIFVRKGKVFLWFSDDDRNVCVRMEAELPVANVKAILQKVDGPGEDSWIEKDDE
jgi:hypothetical protein